MQKEQTNSHETLVPFVHDLSVALPGKKIRKLDLAEWRHAAIDLGSESKEKSRRSLAESFLLVLGFVLVPGGELFEAVVHVASYGSANRR